MNFHFKSTSFVFEEKIKCESTHRTIFFSGIYNVILDETHFKDLLIQHVDPPPATVRFKEERNSV